MTLIAEIHFTMTKPDANPNDVTKALRMYFDDNDLWHDPQLIMCGLTSPTQWPMSPTGDKPKMTLDREGNAYKLAIVCDYEQGNYGLGFDLPTFADRLFWVLDTSPAIRITVESLVIDKDKSYVIYETDDIKPTVLHYLDKYLYGTDADLVDAPYNDFTEGSRLYTIEEANERIDGQYISDYDGDGSLLRQDENGNWFKSHLTVSTNYPIPSYAKEHYTHFIWFNK